MNPSARTRLAALGFALATTSALALSACSSAPRGGPGAPCGPGSRPAPPNPNIVATTMGPTGQWIDWVYPPPDTSGPLPTSYPGLGAGPPGTVPVPRPPQPQCVCVEGYLPQADGSCRPAAEVCVPAGGLASPKSYTACCPGLQGLAVLVREGGQCVNRAIDAQVCGRCGDAFCGPGENDCNCPADCRGF